MGNATDILDQARDERELVSELSQDDVAAWREDAMIYTGATLIFFTVVLFCATYLLKKHNSNPELILRTFGVISIICMASILLIVGYGEKQLTPIIGLFGAIAGYLLGKESTKD